jgi:PKD repeat protein
MKTPLLTAMMSVLLSAALFGQTENVAGNKRMISVERHANENTQITSCGTDTVLYPFLKELVFASPNDSFFIDAMVGNVRTSSQAYHTADNINILGVQFWGFAYSTNANYVQTLQVRTYLYAVDAMNMPTAVLDSADVTITGDEDWYEAYFNTPHTYGQNFAVGVRSLPNDTLAVVTNNAGNAWSPNYGEALGWRRFGSGVWNSTLSFFGQDLEYMIFPIVDYSVSTSFNMMNDTACMNEAQTFTNISDGLFGNHFFNLYAFDEYWGFAAADSSFTWNYGDTPSWETSYDGAHTYTTSGTYTVSLAGEMIGYFTSCSDTFTATLEIMPDVISNFTYDNSAEPTIAFMDGSTGAMTYWWDFGDTATSAAANPSHTYAGAGTYTVTLVTTGFCGSDTTTQTITIIGNGMADDQAAQTTVWYNAGNHSLNITSAEFVTVEVMDVAGNVISSTAVNGRSELDMNGSAAGVYFVRVISATGTTTHRVAVY